MRTPAGKECKYFYGNYFRGRQQEECRLLQGALPPISWKPDLCGSCPVPDILFANACPHLQLKPSLARPFPFTRQQVKVTTSCRQSGKTGFVPHVGCGECHPLPSVFENIKLPGGDS